MDEFQQKELASALADRNQLKIFDACEVAPVACCERESVTVTRSCDQRVRCTDRSTLSPQPCADLTCHDRCGEVDRQRSAPTQEVERCRSIVGEQYHQVCEDVGADEVTTERLWRRAALNPSIDHPLQQ